MKKLQSLLLAAIKGRVTNEYLAPGASPANRRYYEGRIAALLQSLTDRPIDVLVRSAHRWTTEHHQPGDDITYPEGTSVYWLAGCIHAMQDLIRDDDRVQTMGDPVDVPVGGVAE